MSLNQILQRLADPAQNHQLLKIKRGVEKESLRTTNNGFISINPHPEALGSALTHPSITTDFSEALLEFITAPYKNISELLNELDDIHRFVHAQIGEELLWVNSMPCQIKADTDIPIANFGESNVGKMKHIYRIGLGHRYGRSMQTIAGIHYNFSVPDPIWHLIATFRKPGLSFKDIKTDGYFGLIRNFRRSAWLLNYLLGATPSVCGSFVDGKTHKLALLNDKKSFFSPYATSLRMGDLGYQSEAQASLNITYNDLQSYTRSLKAALRKSHPKYSVVGLKDDSGHLKQLNTNLLQIENEFYSEIRPKQPTKSGESPMQALLGRGVEYVEIRCLDLDPFTLLGIDSTTIRFLDTFLLSCLLSESPLSNEHEQCEIVHNKNLSVYQGRNPLLHLHYRGQSISLKEWGRKILTDLQPIASLLDSAHGGNAYESALAKMFTRLEQPALTPSARVIDEMNTHNESYIQFGIRWAKQHAENFKARGPDEALFAKQRDIAKASSIKQKKIELSDHLSFEQYLEQYYLQ
ncbi:MAG: glutamate--cysteine ligase [Cellvibrionales bacterium TMED49]|nr:MAG: glutamate--cysteine ligase [Cellvibrionales bacterium TMED49]